MGTLALRGGHRKRNADRGSSRYLENGEGQLSRGEERHHPYERKEVVLWPTGRKSSHNACTGKGQTQRSVFLHYSGQTHPSSRYPLQGGRQSYLRNRRENARRPHRPRGPVPCF